MHRFAHGLVAALSSLIVALPAQADEELHRLAGSLIISGFQGDTVETQGYKRAEAQLAAGHLGGVIFFRDNVRGISNVMTMAQGFKCADGCENPPPLLAVDEEGGIVQRLRTINVERAKKLGDQGEQAQDQAFLQLAHSVKVNQLNTNFAPVVDLHDKASPIIARYGRAYSDDPERVAEVAGRFVEKHDDLGLLTTLKHFPGHGSALGDSHNGFVDITDTWDAEELVPFKRLIDAGQARMIMTAHLFHADIDPEHPATLSKAFVTDLLRGKLGYDGVVITDDLTMDAIDQSYSLKDAVELAIGAGVDLLLTGNFQPGTVDEAEAIRLILVEAVEEGRISRERLQESHDRVMALRQRLR